jgi:hypothetical protein
LDDQELLMRLKARIEPDLAPVQPLGVPRLRALWLLAVWLALVAGILLGPGPRPDFEILGPWRTVGFSLVEVALCFVLAVVGLRMSIPAMRGSLAAAVSLMAVAVVVHLGLSWATLERSALSPPEGQAWRAGLTCLSTIAALGLGPLVLGGRLLMRGLMTRRLLAFASLGLASGLAAEAAWRLHCEYSAWSHVLYFHTGAVVLFVLVALVAARKVLRT